MTDSVLVLPPGWRALNDNAQAISGAKLKFYGAGTTTPATVYSDSGLLTALGTQVECDSGGYPVSGGGSKTTIYTGTDAYKLVLTDADDTTIWSQDNIKGAVAIPDVSSVATPSTPVIYKTSTYASTSGDQGKLINCDPTGGSFAVTLPDASVVGDGWLETVRHNGSASGANVVTVRTTGGQTITGPSFSGVTAVTLTGLGHAYTFVSDGGNWTIVDEVKPIKGDVLQIVERRASPPSSPVGGQRYIAYGTPTGTWATLGFAEDDIIESDGNGSWFKYSPWDGAFAYVQGETLLTQYRTSAWVDLDNITAPTTSQLKMAVFSDVKAQNTGGGTATANAWTDAVLNTTGTNTIGATLASNIVTLPAGTYKVDAGKTFYRAGHVSIRLYNVTSSSEICRSLQVETGEYAVTGGNVDVPGTPTISDTFTLSAESQIKLQYYANQNTTNSLGVPRNVAGETEKYAYLTLIDITSLQGPRGLPGIQGNDGLDAAYSLKFSTLTSGDPGSGNIAVNNATLSSVTQIQISETDAYGANIAAVLATWDDSTSSNKARVKISKEGATQNFAVFTITGAGTDQGSYWTFPAAYVASGGTLSNGNDVAVDVLEKGDKGDQGDQGVKGDTGGIGATGPNTGLDYAFATATSGDPGSGKLLYNSATPASVTQINISKTGRNSESLGTLIGTWDDSSNTAHRGHLRIFTVADRTKYLEAEITGTLVDNTTYWAIPISSVSAWGTLHASSDVLAVMFERTGNKGADGAGSFTSLSPGAGTTSDVTANAPGSAITTSGTLSAAELVNAQTGTTYTFVDGDRAKLVTFSNAAAIAATLPQAGQTTTFKSGWFTGVVNTGAGTLTITPGTSTINGAASLVLLTGQGCRIVSDGANYQVSVKPISVVLASGKTVTVNNTLTLAGTDGTTMTFPAASSAVLTTGNTATITKGFTVTPNNIGTVSSGTTTPDPANGNYQYLTNNGAFTLAAPSSDCAIDILVTNGASAGSITFSGFTVGSATGSTYGTTNTNKFILSIRRINSVSTYSWYALQ